MDKSCLIVEGFNQRDGIDYKETFMPVSTKYSFRIIMVLLAQYDLELCQMDVKIVFFSMERLRKPYIYDATRKFQLK